MGSQRIIINCQARPLRPGSFKAEPTEAFIENGQCPHVTVVAVSELGRYENLLTRHAALLQRHADGVLVRVMSCGVYQPVTRVESPEHGALSIPPRAHHVG